MARAPPPTRNEQWHAACAPARLQAWGSQVQWWWNPPFILTVLSYHVVPGPGLTTNTLAGKSLPTAAGAAAG